MPTYCCVPFCRNRGGHTFPSQKVLRHKWTVTINRVSGNKKTGNLWRPTATSVVCKKHFTPADYVTETYHGGKPQLQRLSKDAVPSVFPERPAKKSPTKRLFRYKQRQTMTSLEMTKSITMPGDDAPEVGEECTIEMQVHKQEPQEVATQTEQPDAKETKDVHVSTENWTKNVLSIENFKNDAKAIHHFTGLENYAKFNFVLTTLGPAAYQLHYMYGPVPNRISVPDRYFVVLIKLRKHYTNFELSRLFDITEADCYNIFCTWIRFMSLQWREYNIWCSRDLTRFFAPSDFKKQFPTTRVIVDGTECPVKKPKKPNAQKSTFSTYKNRNTVKVLVGITPGGLCSFVSPSYGGSTSDRKVVERSNLPALCDPGDSVMSDKGFDVQDIFVPYDVSVNIPTFFKKRNRMSGKTVLKDRKIASKRVHVERFIGLGKTYKILTQPMNSSETKLSSDIIFVCFMLCNFRPGIVSRDA